MSDRKSWRPWRKPRSGPIIPVHIMRRFFNFVGERCSGIEIGHRGSLHTVTIHFDNAAEASGAYRSLQAMYEARDDGLSECSPRT